MAALARTLRFKAPVSSTSVPLDTLYSARLINCTQFKRLQPNESTEKLPSPQIKAQQLLDKIPGNSLISKTSVVTLATALSAFAISKEFYVFNDDSVVLISFATICALLYSKGGPFYSKWANGHIDRLRGVLNGARADHTDAVRERIKQVNLLENIVDDTRLLYDLSKETAKLEADAFVLEQKVNVQLEASNVLASWARHENNQKQAEQAMLTNSVIQSVEKEIKTDKKLQQRILELAIAETEKILADVK